jgi:hypothetical protein
MGARPRRRFPRLRRTPDADSGRSRQEFPDFALLCRTLESLRGWRPDKGDWLPPPGTVLIHGGAIGVDMASFEAAKMVRVKP